ncbi:Coiled-coil domain-containing protein 87, partial [Nowakowskiella sp. JEL0078]
SNLRERAFSARASRKIDWRSEWRKTAAAGINGAGGAFTGGVPTILSKAEPDMGDMGELSPSMEILSQHSLELANDLKNLIGTRPPAYGIRNFSKNGTLSTVLSDSRSNPNSAGKSVVLKVSRKKKSESLQKFASIMEKCKSNPFSMSWVKENSDNDCEDWTDEENDSGNCISDDDDDPTINYEINRASIMLNDSLLHAHTIREDNQSARRRYLQRAQRFSMDRQNFNYSIFDEEIEDEIPIISENIFLGEGIVERTIQQKDIIRTMDSKVSLRVPKGLINLSAEPASAISEFGSEVDSKLLDSLDEKLSRLKEVEELYDEIMKTITGNHLENNADDIDDLGCPSAPFDHQLPINNVFLGLTPNIPVTISEQPYYQTYGFKIPPTSLYAIAVHAASKSLHRDPISFTHLSNATKQHKNKHIHTHSHAHAHRPLHHHKPTIKLRLQPHLPADDFIVNRTAAMSKLVTSRYNTFKYNYGGYIPYDIDRRRVKRRDQFSTRDYLEFARTRTSDFVVPLLIDERLEEERSRIALKDEEDTRLREDERERAEKMRLVRELRTKAMLRYRRGFFNAGIMEYLAELNERGLSSAEEEKKNENCNGEQDKKSNEMESSTTGSANRLEPLVESEVGIDIVMLQAELEAIWVRLKMPADQKLDMAIKYGSHRFAAKLEKKIQTTIKAIKLWKNVATHIIDRENLLLEIEKFEGNASDPQRFFRHGYEGSSEARLLEAKHREDLMRKLQFFEARIGEDVSMIKNIVNETVTYDGKD